MTVSKLFGLLTPFTLVAAAGLFMVVQGIANLHQENNILNFFFGIPLMLGAAGAHFLVRRVLNGHTLYIWLLEFILVGLSGFAFYHM